ncbi:MAG TPA: hypothetical protein VFZ61_03800 [Polyangiales bacterium]
MSKLQDYEKVAVITLHRSKSGHYACVVDHGTHAEGHADQPTVDAALALAGVDIRRELRSRPTQDELPAVDPHTAPRAFVS